MSGERERDRVWREIGDEWGERRWLSWEREWLSGEGESG